MHLKPMRGLFLILLVGSTTSSVATGSSFWLEPMLSYTFKNTYKESSDTGNGTGFGGGLQLYGYFARNLYLGVMGRYDDIQFDMDSGSSIENVKGTHLSAGPLLGVYTSRLRFWASYLLFDEFDEESNAIGATTTTQTKRTGSGYGLGAGFWVWPKLFISVEYLRHNLGEIEALAGVGNTVNIDFNLSQFVLNFHIPFELTGR